MANQSNQNSGRKQPIDPLLRQRLNQPGQRQGSPLPPPPPGQRPAAAQQGARRAQSVRPGQAPRTVIDTSPEVRSANPRVPAAPRPGAAGQAPRPGKRQKPARSAKMAALAVSVTSTAALAVAFNSTSKSTATVVLTGGTLATSNTATAGSTAGTTAGTTAATTVDTATSATAAVTPTTVKASAKKTVKDGTYTGQASYNRWGAVQVAAVFKGGKLADVQVLQYPDANGRDVQIAQYSLPILIQESVQSQSANVAGVSGASYTSYSYIQSLQSAIDAAKAASGVTG